MSMLLTLYNILNVCDPSFTHEYFFKRKMQILYLLYVFAHWVSTFFWKFLQDSERKWSQTKDGIHTYSFNE